MYASYIILIKLLILSITIYIFITKLFSLIFIRCKRCRIKRKIYVRDYLRIFNYRRFNGEMTMNRANSACMLFVVRYASTKSANRPGRQ